MQRPSFFNMKYNVLYFLEINKSFCRAEQVFPEYRAFPNIGKHYLLPKKIFSSEVSFSCGKNSMVNSTTVQNS